MSTTKVGVRKYMKHRPNDYLYDPVYTVSSRRDFEKTAIKNIINCMEARVRPHFLSMFSELIQYPNADLALIKGSDHIPCFMEQKWDESKRSKFEYKKNEIDIRGKSMTLFLARPAPLSKSFPENYQYVSVPAVKAKSKRIVKEPENVSLTIHKEESEHDTLKIELPKLKMKATQTLYRESSAQTSPWQPPYKIMQTNEEGQLPELLTLGALAWDVGLPAGVYECKMIERARMRRAWERSLIPVKDKEALDKLVDALEKIERSEWAFREKELNRISRVRMDLMIQALETTCTKLSERSMIKIKNYWTWKQNEKMKKLCQLKLKSTRELRKLEMKHKKFSTKYKSRSIVDEYLSYSSELYAPLDRHGEDPKQSHFCCCSDEFVPEFKNVEKLDVVPSWLNNYEKHDPENLWRKKDKKRKICVRATKWTVENLGKLQQMMTDARLRPKKRYSSATSKLLQYIEQKKTPPPTPTTESIPDSDETIYQATLFLQKVIQGRAVQSIIYEGRDRNHELIEEIKTTHALLDADMNMKNLERVNILVQQRARKIQTRSLQKIDEVIQTLEGNTVGSMLDYLNKELLRLQDERKAHAFALLAQRERWKREAAEGGRRQKEERRRREHDEMFKQIVKIHQETVDLYLEDIIMKGLDNQAEADAKAYIKEVANMIDKATECAVKDSDYLQQEEIAADLIHNFVIPEVEKQMIRENLRKKQEKFLLAAHETIYSEINTVANTKQEQLEQERQQGSKRQQEFQEQHAREMIAIQEEVVNNIIKSFDEALTQAEHSYDEVEETFHISLEDDSEENESVEVSLIEDENVENGST